MSLNPVDGHENPRAETSPDQDKPVQATQPVSDNDLLSLLMRLELMQAQEDDRVLPEWRERHPIPAAIVSALSIALRDMSRETQLLVWDELQAARSAR